MDRYFAFIWWFLTKDGETADVEKFKQKLWMPPAYMKGKPIPAASPWSAENETRAFAALKAETSK